MPRYRFKGPDGRSFVVNAPEGATKDQVIAIARQHIASMPKQSEDRGVLRRVDDFVRGVADAATFGYSDEIAAKLGQLTGLGGEQGDYEGNLARQRQRDRQGGTDRLAGQVTGAIALPTSKLSAAKGLKGVAASAAEGAGYGAFYGAGSAEEGKRLEGAKSGAALGAVGGAAGRVVGNTAASVLRGKQVAPAVRQLANEGIVMTPGRRGGAVKRTLEEGFLGSIPILKWVPKAANRRSVEQMNVAAYNRALRPIGDSLPMSTEPGRDAVIMVGDKVYGTYDEAASKLSLAGDNGIAKAVAGIAKGAKASVGRQADQLNAIMAETLEPLTQGSVVGTRVRDMLQDLRGEASGWMTSSVKSEQRIGKELWKLHDALEAALVRQNKGDVVAPFKKAREAVTLFKRIERASGKTADGVFNPTQFRNEVTRKGFGVTPGKVARGEAPMQDLADAAKLVLPEQTPNSGSPERLLATSLATGVPSASFFADPTGIAPVATGIGLLPYAPGIDRFLQNLSLNRPSMFGRAGDAVARMNPALGTVGAFTAINQGR